MGSVDKFLIERLTYLSIAINVTMYHAITAFARTPGNNTHNYFGIDQFFYFTAAILQHFNL